MTRGRLRVDVGTSPLATEHTRLVRTALRRGELAPEIPPGARLTGDFSEHAITLARTSWLARMEHEHQSAAVFSRLLPHLIEAEAPLEYKTVALRMSMDELRHAALCGDVVRLLGGEPEVERELATEPLPEHAGTTARERAMRNVLFVSCLSESIAAPLLAAERELASEPHVRLVLEQLAADETLHARFGWAYLRDTITDAERAGIQRYLPLALGTIEARMHEVMTLELQVDAALEDELAALGVTMGDRSRALMDEVVATVVLPALDALGLDAQRAWRERIV
ncbi:hypothetical protein [Sandaracinus amylolyticus]|uniref:Ferritin-like domain-containing protein n=1 Tax=Sandaracinus amylolyticus TaxID=927083 RepID=A0A0F6SHZ6_9BACT|nr:hypothetical protein [Sandaracinus amylolyticus]AKF11309.1 hypothetical protein DB32_008458 [Sandaracinus amylolyticus]